MDNETNVRIRAVVAFGLAGVTLLLAIFILSYTIGGDKEEAPAPEVPTTPEGAR